MKPTGERWNLDKPHKREAFAEEVERRLANGVDVIVQFMGDERSNPQNAMIYRLYRAVADAEGEPVIDTRRRLKLHYGVPILRSADPAFREVWDAGILRHCTYEEKLRAMEIMPVTSRMSVSQAAEYIDTIRMEYSIDGD